MSKKKSPGKGQNKAWSDQRSINPPHGNAGPHDTTDSGKGFQERDVQNRLGSFEGKGEHARTGNRGHQ
jgi:hypothetical protein